MSYSKTLHRMRKAALWLFEENFFYLKITYTLLLDYLDCTFIFKYTEHSLCFFNAIFYLTSETVPNVHATDYSLLHAPKMLS